MSHTDYKQAEDPHIKTKKYLKFSSSKMITFDNKGSIRGQRSNFRISKIIMSIAISRLKLDEKSIGDGFRAPKCLLLKIRGL